ncbi:heterokaryon incompatibility protein-domain-containing protein [Cadophora sp. MPI-SDFR-AT-0126]|nr:heterokaryon incompatibility protein-domain-containing protein [Leotiomycetes sp. MPI-SDFR-AT-0126]
MYHASHDKAPVIPRILFNICRILEQKVEYPCKRYAVTTAIRIMSSDWMDSVSMVPSYEGYQRTGRLNVEGPALETRQTDMLRCLREQEGITQPQSPAQTPIQHLCERDSILARHSNQVFEPSATASHIFDDFASTEAALSDCELCRLISQLPAYKTGEKYGLYVINILDEKERRVALDYPPEHFVMGLAVSEDNGVRLSRRRLGYLPPPMEGIHKETLLVPTETNGEFSEDDRSPFLARLLDPSQADLDSAKTWIQDCGAFHPACQASSSNLSGIIDVVDCLSDSQKIIPLPVGAEYLALSYVWGPQPVKADPPETSKPIKLSEVPANVPRTIVDAMAVTRALGQRYLWVDRYCIDQNDPVTKAFQLSLMDKIYEAAKVTLVAASGVDDSSGLPGTGTLPLISRDLQPSAWIGDHKVVLVGPDVLTTVKQSKWASRAWTFQEAYLSTRCLIFGPKQLQFLCKTTCRHEALPRLPRLSSYDLKTETNINSVFGCRTTDSDNSRNGDMTVLERFQFLANELLRRNISWESDTLDAFRGILNRVEYFTFFGVPLVTREGRELHKDAPKVPSPSADLTLEMHGPQIVTQEESKRIITSSPLNLTRKRHRPNIFHAGNWFHYPYDEFPGPGEPLHPSPLLAFLYGLTWFLDYESNNQNPSKLERRTGMPSWSWLSLQKGPFRYEEDFSGSTELECDVLLNLHSNVQVWTQQKPDEAGLLQWLPFNEAWIRSTGKIVPEAGPRIKIETQTGDIASLSISRREYGYKEWEFKINLTSSLLIDGKNGGLDIDLDCARADVPDFAEGEFLNLKWKIALVLSTTYYNPKYEEMWAGSEPRRVFLVLMPFEGGWRRIGILSLRHGNRILDVEALTRESLVLC